MRRALFILLSVISLAISLAAGAMWARSARWQDYYHFHRKLAGSSDERSITLEFAGGWVAAEIRVDIGGDATPGLHRHNIQAASDGASRLNPTPGAQTASFAGFALQSKLTAQYRWRRIVMPLWSIILAGAIAPVITVLRIMRRRRRNAPGLCPRCAYDLRASRERCPECGLSIE